MTRTNAYTLLCVAIRAVVVWFFASLLLTLPGILLGVRNGGYDGGIVWLVMGAVLPDRAA